MRKSFWVLFLREVKNIRVVGTPSALEGSSQGLEQAW
jgi:hypothetical protein